MRWTVLFFLTAVRMFSILVSTGLHRFKVSLQPLKAIQELMQEDIS